MSLYPVSQIMARIEVATPKSPIAVFTTPEEMLLEAVFGATIKTMQRINNNDLSFVGCFHKNMDKKEVRRKLYHAVIF